MQLKDITIQRFKRLSHVTFDIDGVNVLLGGNNSGKSTIIQAVHFAFTLFQSMGITNKWPAQNKKSSTVSPSDLIYVPSDDPYSLGYGGRLLEDENKSINLAFSFDDGQSLAVSIRKGRITNILVELDNVPLAKQLSNLSEPYTVFSPGLAGVSRNENYVSDGVLLRALARGDANVVLRNILYRLKQRIEWGQFEENLSQVFPGARIDLNFSPAVDQFITVNITHSGNNVPLDLAGTGILQTVQILSYIHLFAPKIIILDEPDSHLHPNNQRLLCSLLTNLSIERGIQVLITTHSRHVLDALYADAKLLWVQEGSVSPASPDDQVELLLDLGALDIKEKISSGKFKVVVLTEDRVTQYITALLNNSGFEGNETAVLPYNGVTSNHLLKPLVKQIKELSKAAIVVHRDRDYLENDEVDQWKADIRAIGGEPFVTEELDVEGYFCTTNYLNFIIGGRLEINDGWLASILNDKDRDDIQTSYVNGRIDFERKRGTIGKVDFGKLSTAASRKALEDPVSIMKGKQKLAKIRVELQVKHGIRFEIRKDVKNPVCHSLESIAKKYFKKT